LNQVAHFDQLGQRKSVLTLPTKDVDKAMADRAKWRADERR
jgi:hypothetical protein